MSTSHKVQMMNGDVARQRQTFLLRGPHHRDALGGGKPADVQANAGAAHQRENRRERDGLGRRRNGRQAEPRCHFAFVRDAAFREIRVLRPQPHAVTERGRVLHRAKQHAGVDQRRFGLGERDTACLRELAHFGELDPFETDSQRADRIDMRLVERARAVLQHLHEARLVQRRVGVGRTGEARDSAGDGRLHLRFERRLVLEAGLAQAARTGRRARGTRPFRERRSRDRRAIPKALRRSRRPFPRNVERRDAVEPMLRIDDPAVTDLDLHRFALFDAEAATDTMLRLPRGCSSRPSAPRCRT
jgi:hypothetical protein